MGAKLDSCGPTGGIAVSAEVTNEINAVETATEGFMLNFHQIMMNMPEMIQLDTPPMRRIKIPDPTVANGSNALRWKSLK